MNYKIGKVLSDIKKGVTLGLETVIPIIIFGIIIAIIRAIFNY